MVEKRTINGQNQELFAMKTIVSGIMFWTQAGSPPISRAEIEKNGATIASFLDNRGIPKNFLKALGTVMREPSPRVAKIIRAARNDLDQLGINADAYPNTPGSTADEFINSVLTKLNQDDPDSKGGDMK